MPPEPAAAASPSAAEPGEPDTERRVIPVTARNLWFLERGLPLFEIRDFFPSECFGGPAMSGGTAARRLGRKLTLDTDQGWSLETDIAPDRMTFRNCSVNRGTGKWVRQARLKPGDRVVLERVERYRYRLLKEPDDA